MSYAKLRGKIKEVYGTQDAFAEAIGVDRSTMSQKLNGKSVWTATEIMKACEVLKISVDKVHLYFFTVKVGKHTTN